MTIACSRLDISFWEKWQPSLRIGALRATGQCNFTSLRNYVLGFLYVSCFSFLIVYVPGINKNTFYSGSKGG